MIYITLKLYKKKITINILKQIIKNIRCIKEKQITDTE